MPKKKKNELVEIVSDEDRAKMLDEYEDLLEKDPKYSLRADPEDKYGLSELQKQFIETYSEVKSIPLVSQMLNIEVDLAVQMLNMYAVKKEINRINMAQLHRRMKGRILSYDDLAAYLSSLITDENVPLADRLSSRDKVGVVRTLVDINDRRQQALKDPINVEEVDLDEELSQLSVDSIKRLLEQNDINDKKDEAIKKLKKKADLSIEEEAMLRSMPIKELLQFLDKTT